MNRSTGIRFLLLLSSASSCLMLIVYSVSWMPKVTHGFAMYYAYARTVLEGGDFSRIYDNSYFGEMVTAYGMETKDVPNNIPTNALAMLPFAWLQPEVAKTCWTIFSLLALFASIWMILRSYDVRLTQNLGLGLCTLCFLWRPVYDNMALGQLYALILLLLSASLLGIKRGGSMLATLPVASAIVIKGYGVLATIWMALRGQRKRVITTVALVLLALAATLPVFGLSSWSTFYSSVVTHWGTLPSQSHVAYQTVNGFVHHLFSYNAQWSPSPLIELPNVALTAITMGLCIVVAWLGLKKVDSSDSLSFSASVAASVLIAPAAEEYHFVLFLPLVLGLITARINVYVSSRRIAVTDVLSLSAIAMMAFPLKYKGLQGEAFPMILLAYPRLVAGLVLLLLYPQASVGTVSTLPNIASRKENGYIQTNPQ